MQIASSCDLCRPAVNVFSKQCRAATEAAKLLPAGRVVVQPVSCCLQPLGGGSCDASKVTITNTTGQRVMLQPNTTASFAFPLTLAALNYGASGLCSFNMTVSFQVRLRIPCLPAR
jgi:hypothetical protein